MRGLFMGGPVYRAAVKIIKEKVRAAEKAFRSDQVALDRDMERERRRLADRHRSAAAELLDSHVRRVLWQ